MLIRLARCDRVCKKAINLVGECHAVCIAESGWTARLDAAAAQLVHELAHGKTFVDVVPGVELAARIERVTAFLDDPSGQRNVGGDNEITALGKLQDFMVGRIEASRHLQCLDVLGRRRPERLIGNQRHVDAGTLGGPKQDVLDDIRTGIGIDPYPHASISRFNADWECLLQAAWALFLLPLPVFPLFPRLCASVFLPAFSFSRSLFAVFRTSSWVWPICHLSMAGIVKMNTKNVGNSIIAFSLNCLRPF